MTWQEPEWNLHEERKDAWKILKHHTEVASDRIYEELPEILQHSFDEGVAYAREQIAMEIEAEIESANWSNTYKDALSLAARIVRGEK